MYYSVKDFTSSTAIWYESLQCIFYASISIQYCNETENHFVSQNNSDHVLHASWTCVHKLALNDGLFAFLTEPSWPPLLPAPLFQLLPSLLEALLAMRCACRLCFSGRRREVVCYHRLKWPKPFCSAQRRVSQWEGKPLLGAAHAGRQLTTRLSVLRPEFPLFFPRASNCAWRIYCQQGLCSVQI